MEDVFELSKIEFKLMRMIAVRGELCIKAYLHHLNINLGMIFVTL